MTSDPVFNFYLTNCRLNCGVIYYRPSVLDYLESCRDWISELSDGSSVDWVVGLSGLLIG